MRLATALRQEVLYVHTEPFNRLHTGQLGHHCMPVTRPTMRDIHQPTQQCMLFEASVTSTMPPSAESPM
ncbi:uncharacterized protein PITG_14876 [Phytophthora infestans T30-4]|uniref:Uncharacterized protein n=1 Tax=Phytophthora infestans (strain T30-4) TaxID=403677 RepID=D0NP83_PHYIT|nr:uncharacterized protein PITG_14876 [Phytophthora infestans T30-4]EEY62425.1 hypothetical protein PITG_14876 [Phytophthora infestans T30-4]|eukprot:XP_002899061.1 hypothetical protein PITG_14876 [Phytophthora infestans T30-4]